MAERGVRAGLAPLSAAAGVMPRLAGTISPKLLREKYIAEPLNRTRMIVLDTRVILLVGDAIEPAGFFNACERVALVTDRAGLQLAASHGGKTAFEDAKEPGHSFPEPAVGLYL